MTQAARLINHQINIALIIYSFFTEMVVQSSGSQLKGDA